MPRSLCPGTWPLAGSPGQIAATQPDAWNAVIAFEKEYGISVEVLVARPVSGVKLPWHR
ncbi:MAG: hypothetical protein ACXWKC_09235 [Xanthobacteraceae bacterium]